MSMAEMDNRIAVLRLLSRETKAFVLTNEIKLRHLGTHELSDLLDLIAANAKDREAIVSLTLEGLGAAGFRPGELAVLRERLSAPAPSAEPVTSTHPVASQEKTKDLHPPFRVPFESSVMPVFEPGGTPPPGVAGRPSAEPTPIVPAPAPGPAPTATPTPASPAPPPPLPPQAAPAAPVSPAPVETRKRKRSNTTRQSRADIFFGGAVRGGPTEEEVTSEKVKQGTILIAEDDSRARMVYKLKFDGSGYMVEEAEDGTRAWELIQKNAYDAIVLDMKMPGLHGLEVLSRMVDAGSDIPVVICTAHEGMDEEFVVATYPYLTYLVKPVPPEDLVGAVAKLLAEKRAADG